MKKILATVGVLVFLGACSSSAKTTVRATEQDFHISLSSGTIESGKTKFEVTNHGPSVHEFVVFKTDLDEAALPLSEDGNTVDEKGAGLSSVDEVEDVGVNDTKSMTVDLAPGKYVIVCNLPTHYKMGMHYSLTVK